MKVLKPFAIYLVLMLILAGCSLSSSPTPTSTTAVTEQITSTPRPSLTPTQVNLQEVEHAYEDTTYGFSFTYSGLWTLEESSSASGSKVLSLSWESAKLDIEYGFQFEINGIHLPDLPLGEMVSQDPVDFLEQDLPKSVVAEDDRIKLAAYPDPADVFLVDDLYFRILLQETAPLAQNEMDLSGEVLEEAEGILSSFTRIERSAAPPDPYPGWETYINLDYGFVVRYPADWEHEDVEVEIAPSVMEDALLLSKANANLMVGYHFSSNFLPREIAFPGGLLVDEGQVAFLEQQIDKLVLVYGEKDKAVFYNGLEAFQSDPLTFHLSLNDSRAGIGYDALAVPDDVQAQAEAILASVRQFPGTQSPPPEGVKSEGSEYFLTYESCFDLDEGMQVGLDDASCDFRLSKSPGGNDLRISFRPAAPAAFGLDNVFVEQPQASQCAGLRLLSTAAETIAPLDSHHICFQTNAGRYGYLIFRALTSDGVSFDWQTATTAGPLRNTGVSENAAITLEDVTVPDGTVFEPGEMFEKTWQVMNTGAATWTTEYAIRFKQGDRMGAPFEVPLPKQVPPGGAVNITVAMVAPQQPGEYTSHWVLRDAQGQPFGVGANGDETFWALIVVEEAGVPEEEEEEEETPGEEKLVVETSIEIDPVDYSGACPASLKLRFSITTEGTDHYTYEMLAGAVQEGFEFYMPAASEVTLAGSGRNTKTVEYTLTMQNSVDGWLQLIVTDPGEYRSEKVYFTVNCE